MKLPPKDVLSLIVAGSGALVLLGWALGAETLKRVAEDLVTMKPTTAVAFLASGLGLYALGREGKAHTAIRYACSWTVFFLMAGVTLDVVTGARVGFLGLFAQEAEQALWTVTPGMPSLGTIVLFLCISVLLVNPPLRHFSASRKYRWGGHCIGGGGTLALVGYLLDVPALYYYIDGLSTAMAVHTAFLFCLLGISMHSEGARREAMRWNT